MDRSSPQLAHARSLPWPDASYGLVLPAVPLYHLGPAGRALALREAVRVVVPGGLVAAVAVNRYANLFGATIANQLGERRAIVDDILATGYSHDNDRVPHMYYNSPAELVAEFAEAGLTGVDVRGPTGPRGWLTVAIDRHFPADVPPPATLRSPDPLHTALTAARDADAYPDLTASSAQLMAVGVRACRA